MILFMGKKLGFRYGQFTIPARKASALMPGIRGGPAGSLQSQGRNGCDEESRVKKIVVAAGCCLTRARLVCADALSPQVRAFLRVDARAVCGTRIRAIDGTGSAVPEDQTIEPGRIFRKMHRYKEWTCTNSR
jgi:hypothetical protein